MIKLFVGEIHLSLVPIPDSEPTELLTTLDHESMEIVHSNGGYGQDEIEAWGWDGLVACVEEDHARYAAWERGEWHYATLRCEVEFKTQLTNRQWIHHWVRVPDRGKYATDDKVKLKYNSHIMEALLDMFETLRTLGFLKQQIITAIPKTLQPSFRKEIAKIKYQNERIYQ